MKKFIFPLVAVLGFAACTPENENPMGDVTGGDEIKLTMKSLSIDTRAPFTGQIAEQNALLARVLCSDKSDDYTNEVDDRDNGFINFTVAATNTGFCQFDGTEIGKFFPQGVSTVYLCGLYPNPKETFWTNNGTTATCTFDGSDDVMYAPEVTTVKNGAVGNLAFTHQMTKLEVKVQAADAASATAWGDITSLTLTGIQTEDNTVAAANVNSVATVDLAAGTTSFGTPVASLPFYGMKDATTYTNTVVNTLTLSETPATNAVAYTICEAITADGGTDNEFQLAITTENRPDPTYILVNLKGAGDATDYSESTAGQSFTVNLSFSATEIFATASVKEWTPQGETDVTVE